jgi:hypothetical protein
LRQLVNSGGNPGVFFSNPDPTCDKPPPMGKGLGFHGFGLGFPGVGRVQKTAWVGDPHTCLQVRVASGLRVVRRVQKPVHPYTFPCRSGLPYTLRHSSMISGIFPYPQWCRTIHQFHGRQWKMWGPNFKAWHKFG